MPTEKSTSVAEKATEHAASTPFQVKCRSYLQASYPYLWIKTHEERRVIGDILSAFNTNTKTAIYLYRWDAEAGLRKGKCTPNGTWEWQEVASKPQLMSLIKECRGLGGDVNANREVRERHVVIFQDFHPYIEVPIQIRALRNSIDDLKKKGNMFIFISPVVKIPTELEKDFQLLEYSLPDETQLGKILDNIRESVTIRYNEEKAKITPEVRSSAIEACKGLTYGEGSDAFALGFIESGKFDQSFVNTVFDEKTKQVKQHGLLQYIKPDVTFDNIGGMDGLKRWIRSRAKAYTEEARAYKLPYPKGILLCGIPGCGKTLLAKATAREFNFPLFQVDMGALFGKQVNIC